MFRQGATPKGVLSIDEPLEPEDAVTIRDQWQATYGGIENAGRIAVLDRGARFQQISQNNDQAQLVEQREFGATEIASILNIPPAMIGAKGASLTYQNAQQNDLHFLKFTLRPWLQYIEDALNADPDLFGMTSAWVPRFNTDEITRPDNQARADWYTAGIRDGWLEVDEVRRYEGLPPLTAAPAPTAGEGMEATE
jgi:HK97 family phage portal protein